VLKRGGGWCTSILLHSDLFWTNSHFFQPTPTWAALPWLQMSLLPSSTMRPPRFRSDSEAATMPGWVHGGARGKSYGPPVAPGASIPLTYPPIALPSPCLTSLPFSTPFPALHIVLLLPAISPGEVRAFSTTSAPPSVASRRSSTNDVSLEAAACLTPNDLRSCLLLGPPAVARGLAPTD
jgi:hypothetical protein